MTILKDQRVVAKFEGNRWYRHPNRVAKVVMAVREMSATAWATLPDAFARQYELMRKPGGADKAEFDFSSQGHDVKFFSTAVSITHQYAAMGVKLDGFKLKRQQADGAKEDEVVLYFEVTVELDNASVPWMGQTFGADLILEISGGSDEEAASEEESAQMKLPESDRALEDDIDKNGPFPRAAKTPVDQALATAGAVQSKGDLGQGAGDTKKPGPRRVQ